MPLAHAVSAKYECLRPAKYDRPEATLLHSASLSDGRFVAVFDEDVGNVSEGGVAKRHSRQVVLAELNAQGRLVKISSLDFSQPVRRW